MSLVKRARRAVGNSGKVVVSIYVNPTQFGPKEDFSRYPRDLRRDVKLCQSAGVDVVFAPSDGEMYPGLAEGRYGTFVVEEHLARRMEGASRPGHFRGVTTVVLKLFNIVRPDTAVFGAKDWQQAVIIRRMGHDLNLPVNIVVAPTVREADGLALSSRNRYLTGDLRQQATVLCRSIRGAKSILRRFKSVSAARLTAQTRRLIEKESAARLDYVEFFDPETLAPVSRVKRGSRMALAVFVGRTRLIDNSSL